MVVLPMRALLHKLAEPATTSLPQNTAIVSGGGGGGGAPKGGPGLQWGAGGGGGEKDGGGFFWGGDDEGGGGGGGGGGKIRNDLSLAKVYEAYDALAILPELSTVR